jgi:uncharacterized phage protein (TIGR01671 family)
LNTGDVKMDREIKFRALTNCGVEVYGYYVHDEHLKLHYIDTGKGVMLEIKVETLGQYTGLKDKNGKEIYEGDIYHMGDENIKYIVVWNDTGLTGKQLGSSSYAGLSYWQKNIEIIGNIYDNPELLSA